MLFWKDVGERDIVRPPTPVQITPELPTVTVFYSRVARHLVGSREKQCGDDGDDLNTAVVSHYHGEAVMRLSSQPYLTAHFAAVSKINVHWVVLKHRLNTWTLAHIYYIDIGTYCCVFITLLQKRIASFQNSNIRGLSLKVNALSCWKYALHQPQP